MADDTEIKDWIVSDNSITGSGNCAQFMVSADHMGVCIVTSNAIPNYDTGPHGTYIGSSRDNKKNRQSSGHVLWQFPNPKWNIEGR